MTIRDAIKELRSFNQGTPLVSVAFREGGEEGEIEAEWQVQTSSNRPFHIRDSYGATLDEAMRKYRLRYLPQPSEDELARQAETMIEELGAANAA